MKATKKYFPVVLFIMLFKVILTFESVDEILKCETSNDTSHTIIIIILGVYRAPQDNSPVADWATLSK